jgi:renalase
MTAQPPYDVLIIGSGMAGLAAADAARTAGLSCIILDKGRRIGGRVATRRADGFTFNHGAQFLTARDAAFITACAGAKDVGALADWQVAGRSALCGAPTMRDFPAQLGAGFEIRQTVEVTHIESNADGVTLHDKDGAVASGRQLVITVPAPQAARLLQDVEPDLAATAGLAEYAPCWTGMYGFDAKHMPPVADPLRHDSGPVGWAVWEDHRPAASGQTDGAALIVQAAPDWSAKHLEEDSTEVAATLLAAFRDLSGLALDSPRYEAAHRWRYARVMRPAPDNATRISRDGRIALAGDWLAGARIEDAWLSGRQAMARLVDAG